MATKYQVIDSCNACGDGINEIHIISTIGGCVCEAKTVCNECGHVDYWAYGFFESGTEIISKAKTYSFD